MAIKITLKNSVVQDSVPTTTHLAAVGELALNANINSLGIYMRASDNTIVKMAGPGSLTTPAASTTVAGISEYATNTETTTGTATDRTVTPAGLAAVTSAERSTSNSTYLALAGGTLTNPLVLPNASNAAPALTGADTDSGVYFATNSVSLAAGGTARLTADANGVGIGTSGTSGFPLSILSAGSTGKAIVLVGDATNEESKIYFRNNANDANKAWIQNDGAELDLVGGFGGAVSFQINDTEKARVDSSGRLLVGSSSTIPVGSTASALSQFHGTANALVGSFVGYANNSGGAVVALGKSRGAIATPGTTVQDNDNLGTIRFAGDDGTDIQTQAALFECNVDGTVASNQIPAEFVLKTAASDGTMTTRLTIDSAGLVNVPDNGKFTAGASDDLQIYHDGTHSYLKNTGGNIVLQGNDVNSIVLQSVVGENALICNANTNVELYYNNSKKLETTSSGVNIGGNQSTNPFDFLRFGASQFGAADIRPTNEANHKVGLSFYTDGTNDSLNPVERLRITSSGNVNIANDSGKLQLGASQDLEIFHDGTNNYLVGSPPLFIRSNNLLIQNGAGTEGYISAIENGAVELYYNNGKRVETTDYGITVTGNSNAPNASAWATQSSIITSGSYGGAIAMIDGSAGFVQYLSGNGADWWLKSGANDATPETNIKATHNGAVKLYYNGGNKLETTSTGIEVTGNVIPTGYMKLNDNQILYIGSSNDLQIYHDGSNSIISDTGTGNLNIYTNGTGVNIHSNAGENIAKFIKDGAVELYYDNSKKLGTDSWGTHFFDDFGANDSIKLLLGNGNDLQIYHDGDHSRFRDVGTGYIIFESDTGVLIKNEASNENIAKFIPNGAVELYYDNSKKLQTESWGVKVFSRLGLDDNVKTTFGNGDDLEIYHDGSNSYFNNTTGFLNIKTTNGGAHYIDADDQYFRTAGGEDLVKMNGDGAVELYYDNVKKAETRSDGFAILGDCIPAPDNTYDLGQSNARWDDVYATNGTINTSDRNEKNTILESDLGLDFVNKLKPVSYKWNKDDSKTHYGLIAQDIEEILSTEGKTDKDFAALNIPTEGPRGLNYSELISPLIKAVQELSAEVETLKTKVAALEGA